MEDKRHCVKVLIILSLIGVLFLNFTSLTQAITTDLRANYSPGETIIIKISGNILEQISQSQVEFKRGHVSVPAEYEIINLGGDYFLWALAPLGVNNYTLHLNDISTTVQGKVKKIDFEQNFSVYGNVIDYSVKPGIIFAKEDFQVIIQLNEDGKKEIGVNFPAQRTVTLKPGINTIDFEIGDVVGAQLTSVQIGNYILPAYIVGEKQSSSIGGAYFEIDPIKIEKRIFLSEKEVKFPVRIFNRGSGELKDITIEYNKAIFTLSMDKISSLSSEGEAQINISLKEIPSEEKELNEKLIIGYNGSEIEVPILINFYSSNDGLIENRSYQNKTGNVTSSTGQGYYCSELAGIICAASETCSIQTIQSKDGPCCAGLCEKETKSSKSWIGYLIAGIALLIILFIFIKYKKTEVGENPIQKRIDAEESRKIKQ